MNLLFPSPPDSDGRWWHESLDQDFIQTLRLSCPLFPPLIATFCCLSSTEFEFKRNFLSLKVFDYIGFCENTRLTALDSAAPPAAAATNSLLLCKITIEQLWGALKVCSYSITLLTIVRVYRPRPAQPAVQYSNISLKYPWIFFHHISSWLGPKTRCR